LRVGRERKRADGARPRGISNESGDKLQIDAERGQALPFGRGHAEHGLTDVADAAEADANGVETGRNTGR
jgi:hypothetical protein